MDENMEGIHAQDVVGQRKRLAFQQSVTLFKAMHFVCLSSSPLTYVTAEEQHSYLDILDTQTQWGAVQQGLKDGGAKLICVHTSLTPETLRAAVVAQPAVLMICARGSGRGMPKECALVGSEADFRNQHLAQPFTHASLLSTLQEGVEQRKKGGDRRIQLVCLSLVGASGTEETARLFAKALKVDHVVHSGDNTHEDVTEVFFAEFFEQVAGNDVVSVREAYENLVEDGPQGLQLLADKAFFQAQALDFGLLQPKHPAALKLAQFQQRLLLDGITKPHKWIPAYRSDEATWAKAYRFQRDVDTMNAILPLHDRRRRHTVLWGARGMGKTTVAQRIAYYCASRTTWFRGGVFYLDGLSDDFMDNIMEGLPKMTGKFPRLLVLDNMDPHGNLPEDEVASLLKMLKVGAHPLLHVLITCRASPGKKVLDVLGKCEVMELRPIQSVQLGSAPVMFHEMTKRRQGDPARPTKKGAKGNGPWDWTWQEDDKHLEWVFHELIGGSPGMLEMAREVAVKGKCRTPAMLRQLWGKLNLEEGDDGKLRVPAKTARKLFGRGNPAHAEDARYVGAGGWLSSSSDGDDADDFDDRDSRRRRGGRRGRRDQGKRRLRELREERRELLAERRRLRRRVREVKAILRRARGLCL